MKRPKIDRAEYDLLLKKVETETVEDIVNFISIGNKQAGALPPEVLNKCLLMACQTRHLIRIHLSLRWGAHLECRDDMGNTPLLICSKNGCKDLVQLLLQRGADVNAFNSSGDTPLILSIRSPGHLDTMKELLADKKIDVNRQNQAGCTALQTAIEELDLDAIRILLFANASYDEDENFYQENQEHLGKLPKTGQHVKENAAILAKRLGLRNLLRNLKTIYRPTPLLKACLVRDLESVRILVDSKFSQVKSQHSNDYKVIADFLINLQKEGRRVSDGDIEIVKELINYGASVDAHDTNSELPIVSAVMLGNCELVDGSRIF